MRRTFLLFLFLSTVSFVQAQQAMTKEKDGTYIVNTTTLADDVQGYNGTTPVKVYIKKGKIVKVEILKNQDGPKFNAKVKNQMLPAYEGMSVRQFSKKEVDGVTGATFTSNAVKENVSRAIAYYLKWK